MFEGFAGSMALLAVTLVGLLLLRDHLSVETVALVLLLPPLVAALSGRALALVMAAFGALLFNFFFLQPYYTLSIETGRGVAAFLVYAAVAMLVAVVAGRLRETRAEADRRIRQEQALHAVALDLLEGATREDVLRARLQGLADALGVDAAATVDGTRAILAGDATPALLAVELPSVRYHAAGFGERGRVVIDGGVRLDRAQTQVIDTLALPARRRAGAREIGDPVIVDRAAYRDGVRDSHISTFEDLVAVYRTGEALAWLGLYEPTREELESVARAFGLHALAVEDAIKAHQRPKFERYGDTLFIVLRPARYVDENETVVFGEIEIFVGPSFVISVRHGDAPDLGHVRRTLEGRPDILKRGPIAVVYGIADHVVDGYQPVVSGLENDIDEIEDEVFTGSATASRRTYELTREVTQFQRATKPLPEILKRLIDLPDVDVEERRYLRNVHDHAVRIEDQVDGFRMLLQNILSVHLTLETKALTEVSIHQNEQVQKISAWAAILFAPTLIGTIYGMNFDHMPELHWRLGYPMAIALMVAVSLALYVIFKRRRWI